MGETALVTGASSGLGRYVATRLTAEGWDVLGTGLRPEDELKEPGLFSYLQADLSLPDSCSTVTDRLDGTPDLVVHCAVAYPPQGAPTPAELESVMRVNALAPYFLTMDVLASRPADRFCSCVVVNSEVVFAADEHSAPYAASKAALRMLTAGLAAACAAVGRAWPRCCWGRWPVRASWRRSRPSPPGAAPRRTRSDACSCGDRTRTS